MKSLAMLSTLPLAHASYLVPSAPPAQAWSYYCTWATQNYEYCANPALIKDRDCSTLSWKDLEGGTGNSLADTQCTELIAFSPANSTCPGCGWVDFHPKARGDLNFLFDAGWGGGRGGDCGASFKADPAKFPGLSKNGTASETETLAAAAALVHDKGWHGLGLWVGDMNADSNCESFWTQRSQWSKDAGVMYWKVDGPDRSALVSPLARKVHPDLVVEHATGAGGKQACGLMTMPYSHATAAVDLIKKTDTFRTYDVAAPHSIPSTLDRLGKFLLAIQEQGHNDKDAAMFPCSSANARVEWAVDEFSGEPTTIRLVSDSTRLGWAKDTGLCLTASDNSKGASLRLAACSSPAGALQLFNFTKGVSGKGQDCKPGDPACQNIRLASPDSSGAPLCLELRCTNRRCETEGQAWIWQCNAGYEQNITWSMPSQSELGYKLQLALSEDAGGPFCLGVERGAQNTTKFLGILNGEDEVLMNAALGASSGVMRNPLVGLRPAPNDYDMFLTAGGRHIKRRMDEVSRALRWQRISPPRGLVDDGLVLVSQKTMSDTWTYNHGDTFCVDAAEESV